MGNRELTRPLVIAHRGGAGEGPENTRTAFARALGAGADGIECDVHLTADGVLVVHHDLAVATTPGGEAMPIASLTCETVTGCDLGWTHGPAFDGETAPTFDEVIDLVGTALLMVEMKRGPDDRVLGEALAARLARDPHLDRRIAASFATDALVAVKMGCPQIRRLGLVREAFDIEAQLAQELWGQGFLRDLIPGPEPDQARARGRQVWAWTVDASDQLSSLMAAGVEALITDVPEAIVHALDEQL